MDGQEGSGPKRELSGVKVRNMWELRGGTPPPYLLLQGSSLKGMRKIGQYCTCLPLQAGLGRARWSLGTESHLGGGGPGYQECAGNEHPLAIKKVNLRDCEHRRGRM